MTCASLVFLHRLKDLTNSQVLFLLMQFYRNISIIMLVRIMLRPRYYFSKGKQVLRKNFKQPKSDYVSLAFEIVRMDKIQSGAF